jgi:hypothetical protein
VRERDRRPLILFPGPGPGAGFDREPQRTILILARTSLVATIVVGQLWGLSAALNAYLQERMTTVWWLLAFEIVSFGLALMIWLLAPRDR